MSHIQVQGVCIFVTKLCPDISTRNCFLWSYRPASSFQRWKHPKRLLSYSVFLLTFLVHRDDSREQTTTFRWSSCRVVEAITMFVEWMNEYLGE